MMETVQEVVRKVNRRFPIAEKGAVHVAKVAAGPSWGLPEAREAADLLSELGRAVADERGLSPAAAEEIVSKSREGRALRAVHDAIHGHQGATEWATWADRSPSILDLPATAAAQA
jgi:L-alanine-DL-glutamate epimerase-like enolase superfamily enzyme